MSERNVGEETAHKAGAAGGAAVARAASGSASASSLPTMEEFLNLLDRSQLVRSRQLETMRTRVLSEGQLNSREFAMSLVESGHLTRWQAERLLGGKAGFQLGKYRLLDRIGVGGMAVVLKGKQPGLGRTVAIKVLARTLLKRKDAVRRFFREIEAASALDHPNIVRAIDSDCIDGVPFLVMEYVEGRDLNSLTQQRGPMSIAWACEFCRQAAFGLQHAFEQGIVHRDIKPANLLATRRSPAEPLTVKILDFGLARFASDTRDSGSLTAAHQIFGTVDFISPEQARSARSADTRSDIFSLGCTLFYLMTGKPPFKGETAMEKLTARIADQPISLKELRPETPDELLPVIARMLAHDPADRYQTPAEVAVALAPFAAATADNVEESTLTRRPEDRSIASAANESEIALENFLGQLPSMAEASESGDAIVARRRRGFPTMVTILLLAILMFIAVTILRRSLLNETDSTRAPGTQGANDGDRFDPDISALSPGIQNAGWGEAQSGLVVAWHAGLDLKLTGNDFAPTWGLALEGKSKTNAAGELLIAEGGARVNGPGEQLAATCGRTNEFSLELELNAGANPGNTRRIVTIASRHEGREFQLSQSKEELTARLQTSLTVADKSAGEVPLCRLSAGATRHLIVSYRDGQLICYLDGEKTSERDDVRGDLSGWQCDSITLGDSARPSRSWNGSIVRFAFFNRFFDPKEARARFQRARLADPAN